MVAVLLFVMFPFFLYTDGRAVHNTLPWIMGLQFSWKNTLLITEQSEVRFLDVPPHIIGKGDDIITEVWSSVDGYEGLYSVSSLGRVKSHYFGKERILRPRVVRGYCTVALFKDGKRKNYFIHRLVAYAFISNPNNKTQINHIDGNKVNNRCDNLEWCTASENQKHAFSHGLNNAGHGETSRNHKLTDDIVREIRRLYVPRDRVYGCQALAERYGVSHQYISELVRNKKWKQVRVLLVSEAAKRLHMNTQTLRLALQQGKFPFGVAIKTSENRYVYHIDENRLQLYLEGRDLRLDGYDGYARRK